MCANLIPFVVCSLDHWELMTIQIGVSALLCCFLMSSILMDAQVVNVPVDTIPSLPDIVTSPTPPPSTSKPSNSDKDTSSSSPSIPPSPLAPSGVTIKRVPSFDLEDRNLHFANEVADRDLPVIIRGSKVDEWKAAQWTPSSLGMISPSTIPIFSNVVVRLGVEMVGMVSMK
jgi:hypothetical protein